MSEPECVLVPGHLRTHFGYDVLRAHFASAFTDTFWLGHLRTYFGGRIHGYILAWAFNNTFRLRSLTDTFWLGYSRTHFGWGIYGHISAGAVADKLVPGHLRTQPDFFV
jgi:hypothetical protein